MRVDLVGSLEEAISNNKACGDARYPHNALFLLYFNSGRERAGEGFSGLVASNVAMHRAVMTLQSQTWQI